MVAGNVHKVTAGQAATAVVWAGTLARCLLWASPPPPLGCPRVLEASPRAPAHSTVPSSVSS
eukprot:359590-Chlamydomonas_euryale.AAC.6